MIMALLLVAFTPRPGLTPRAAVVTITATDFAFSRPRSVAAGLVTLRMINTGHQLHMMGVARFRGTYRLSDALRALQTHEPLDSLLIASGGPNMVAPGDTSNATIRLEPGHYALICWATDAAGRMHISDGMVSELDVTPAAGPAPPEPAADARISLRDYSIELSRVPPAGRAVFEVSNLGPQEHDVQLIRLERGATLENVGDWVMKGQYGPRTPPAPARFLGGMVGLHPGTHATFTANLLPGDYVLLCLVPDEHNVAHFMGHAMLHRFTVK